MRSVWWCVAVGVLGGGITIGGSSQDASGARPYQPPVPSAPPAFKAVADKYCVTCHSDRLKTGGVTLEHVDFDDVGASADTLEKAVRKLLVGSMPPQGMPRPDPATLAVLRRTGSRPRSIVRP